jgi:hypothetical protein
MLPIIPLSSPEFCPLDSGCEEALDIDVDDAGDTIDGDSNPSSQTSPTSPALSFLAVMASGSPTPTPLHEATAAWQSSYADIVPATA